MQPAATDPREIIAKSPMSRMQVAAVAVTVGLNALDGFDVLSIAFAGPGIKAAWSIDQAQLGYVLSAELFGMAIGSLFLGGVADKIGRRPTILGCLVLMLVGMFMAAHTEAASTTCMILARDHRPRHRRRARGHQRGGRGVLQPEAQASVRLDHVDRVSDRRGHRRHGSPRTLLKTYSWPSVFYLGAGFTALFIPLTLIFIPESPAWLTRKQPARRAREDQQHAQAHGPCGDRRAAGDLAGRAQRSIADIFGPGLILTVDPRGGGLLLPHHHRSTSCSSGRRTSWRTWAFPASARRQRAGVGERGRRARGRDARSPDAPFRREGPDHRVRCCCRRSRS